MGLMDKVKAQASSLAQQANQGMAKLDNLPAQRRADALLRSLGVAVLAQHTGRATGDTEAQITQILSDIAQHEQQHNVDLVQQAAQAQAQQAQQQSQAQQWQGQQMQGPGDFLTSAPPADPNVSGVPPAPGGAAPGYGDAPGYGGQPGYQQPGGFPQQPPQTGFPQQPPQTGFPQQGGAAGFPPSTSFPEASPAPPDTGDEEGQSSFFPPASGA